MTAVSPVSIPRVTKQRGSAWYFPTLVSLVTLALTTLPYLIGASFANGRRYMWLGYNLDDSCVYLSWMRQAADGSVRAYNLFTTDPQNGLALNPLFLILGRFAGVTGLPLLMVYHSARLLFGFGFLLLLWRFIRTVLCRAYAQKLAFLFTCFSAGLGWLPFWWNDSPIATPIDKWQPEAISFLSLYLSPLFCFSLLLQVGILYLLLQGERNGKLSYAVYAGLCGLLLGLVHTYDIITLAAVWGGFLLLGTLLSLRQGTSERRNAVSSWLRGVVAAAIAAPGVLYIAYQLHQETVFRERANVPTLSPALTWVILGYGLTFILALIGIYALWNHGSKNRTGENAPVDPERLTCDANAARLLLVWFVANLAVAYLPVPFQRKMLQGAHLPIALLAGVGAAWRLQPKSALPATMAAWGLTLFLCLTNVRFMLREVDNYARNRVQSGLERAYLLPGELEALDWIQANTPKDAAIQPLPWLAMDELGHRAPIDITLAGFVPGLIHRHVYCGHWGETPDFGPTFKDGKMTREGKFIEVGRFGQPQTTDSQRMALLRKMSVRYLVFSQKASEDTNADLLLPLFRRRVPLPNYLILRHSNPDADVYEVAPFVFNPGSIPSP